MYNPSTAFLGDLRGRQTLNLHIDIELLLLEDMTGSSRLLVNDKQCWGMYVVSLPYSKAEGRQL